MTQAQIGDLIVWSAQSQFSPMRFGIVYDFDTNGLPMVHTEVKRYRKGAYVRSIGKTCGGSNYLVIRTRDGGFQDDRISEAIYWHRNWSE